MNTKGLTVQNINAGRLHELDWPRMFAMLVLLLYHTARIFDTDWWHVKNEEITDDFHYWLALVSTWRMPLLFFISGAGTYLAFRKSSAIHYIADRFKRLIVPLLFAMVTMLPIQTYYEHISEFSGFWDFYKSVIHFIPYYQGNLNLYHLWFLKYLFVYSMLAIPILLFLRSERSLFLRSMRINPLLIMVVPPMIPLVARFVFMPEHGERYFFSFYFCYFLFGVAFYCNSHNRESIYKSRAYCLIAALVLLLLYSLTYGYGETTYFFKGISMKQVNAIISIFLGWFWLAALLGYAQRYFNSAKPWQGAINEGIYPFYILHQTFVVVIGYYICQLSWSIAAKFWAINFLTLFACIIFYVGLIRPFNVVRFCFGMKSKREKPVVSPGK